VGDRVRYWLSWDGVQDKRAKKRKKRMSGERREIIDRGVHLWYGYSKDSVSQ